MTGAHGDVVVVDCIEYGYVEVDSDLWVGRGHTTTFSSDIDGRDVLRATFNQGQVRLQATSYVGVIPLNEQVVVRVKPRFPIANLTRMVIDTGHNGVLALAALRGYSGRGTADEWTRQLYTDALLGYVDDLLDRGMMRRYERRTADGHFPRGRVEVSTTLQRFAARGVPNKAAFSWFERTVDISPNRCLKAALEQTRLGLTAPKRQQRKGDRSRLARLAGQLAALDQVSDDPDLTCLADDEVVGLRPLPQPRDYYRSALDVALLVLQDKGIDLDIGGSDDVRMSSLLIDTNSLFENFVRTSLAKHAIRDRWPADVLDGNTPQGWVDLYHVPSPPPAPFGQPLTAVAARDKGKAQPDIVIRGLGGQHLLVAEVKNTPGGAKGTADALPPRPEVHQAITYALRYQLPLALLIHPWSQGAKGLLYVGRISDIDVYDYRLDLSTDAGTDAAIADMASVVARLAGLSP